MIRALLIASVLSLCMAGCSPSRVLVQSRQTDSVRIDEKIRIRTQIKYVPVIVHIPDQQMSVIAEPSDTSHLETQYAASDAFIRPDGKLYHDLRNKPQEKSEIVPIEITDTTATSTIVRQEQERIEVPVPMPLTWWQRFWNMSGKIAWGLLAGTIIGIIVRRKS